MLNNSFIVLGIVKWRYYYWIQYLASHMCHVQVIWPRQCAIEVIFVLECIMHCRNGFIRYISRTRPITTRREGLHRSVACTLASY